MLVPRQAYLVCAMLDFLGIEGGEPPADPPPKRQGDARSALWRQRYLAEGSVA